MAEFVFFVIGVMLSSINYRYVVQMIPPGTDVPSGFEIDVTDPMLYNACGVPLPEMCESQSDRVTSAAAPSLALPPLVALLFGTLLAKLFP